LTGLRDPERFFHSSQGSGGAADLIADAYKTGVPRELYAYCNRATKNRCILSREEWISKGENEKILDDKSKVGFREMLQLGKYDHLITISPLGNNDSEFKLDDIIYLTLLKCTYVPALRLNQIWLFSRETERGSAIQNSIGKVSIGYAVEKIW
jgi:hypothetical protein